MQGHAGAAVLALIIGIAVLFMTKGTALHVALGRIWAALMMGLALASFWITGLNPGHWSWIHLLSLLTLIAIPKAILAKRRGDIRGHALGMTMTFAGLVIAGAFTLVPGRILGAALFGW